MEKGEVRGRERLDERLEGGQIGHGLVVGGQHDLAILLLGELEDVVEVGEVGLGGGVGGGGVARGGRQSGAMTAARARSAATVAAIAQEEKPHLFMDSR